MNEVIFMSSNINFSFIIIDLKQLLQTEGTWNAKLHDELCYAFLIVGEKLAIAEVNNMQGCMNII